MATFVLVHGAWRGGWCWQRVARILRCKGHVVYTPTLSGLADRSHLLSADIDLNTHINDVANLLKWEELNGVVLCGHSYGGTVITGAADREAARLSALVYLDAFVPGDGESVWESAPEEHRAGFLEGAKKYDGLYVDAIPAAAFGVNEADQAWVDAQCTPMPLACFRQPISLSGACDSVASKVYVLAEGWGPSLFPSYHADRAGRPDWVTRELPCGHDVELDMPEAVADILEGAADGP